MFPSPTKDFGYNRCWYEKNRKVEFEGHLLEGMKESEQYLTHTYGDYLTLPPEEKRKVHPVSKIKLL